MNQVDTIKITAPAKINLFLHVTGKRKDGYHQLQSLVSFADFGDKITIAPADEFKFSFDSTAEHLPTDGSNLIICAANLLTAKLGKKLNCHIHLSKNIPIGAGLGGGSSNAAATIRGLLQFWGTDIDKNKLDSILIDLGADVPACYHGTACYFEGIGDVITPIKSIPSLHTLLIYPNQHCSTKDIFDNYDGNFSTEVLLPKQFKTRDELLHFLLKQKNDLKRPAIKSIPEINIILEELKQQQGCLLSRMSGSGSACFGIFNSAEQVELVAKKIKAKNPNLWVQSVTLQ